MQAEQGMLRNFFCVFFVIRCPLTNQMCYTKLEETYVTEGVVSAL